MPSNSKGRMLLNEKAFRDLGSGFVMSVLNKKIVTLIPSATEIVAFLGEKKSIIGRSHECDYPKDLNNVVKLTSPKINIDGTSGEIDKQINVILENSLSVYKVDVKKLKNLLNGKTAMVHLLIKMALNMLESLKTENFQVEELLHGEKGNLLERNTLENF